MKTKKSILCFVCLALTLTLSFILCSCGGNTDVPTPSNGFENIDMSTDKTKIEGYITQLTGESITLPSATVSGEVVTVEGKQLYKISISNSDMTAEDYYVRIAAALENKNWTLDDGAFKKVEDTKTKYIVFEAESGTDTSFIINIFMSDSETDTVSYSYSVTQPTKREYYEGESLDLTGFALVRTGSDNTVVTLTRNTDYTIDESGFDSTLQEGQSRKECLLPVRLVNSTDFSTTIVVTIIARPLTDFVGADVTRKVIDYNTEAHSVTVTMPTNADNVSLRYAVSEDGYNFGDWSTVLPEYSLPGQYYIKVEFKKVGYTTLEKIAYVRINALTFDCEEMPLKGFSVQWDGQPHVDTTVLSLPDGTLIEYRLGTNEWTTTAPSFTDVSENFVEYRISKTGYVTIQQFYRCTISKADIPLSIVNETDYLYLAVFEGKAFSPNISGVQNGDSVWYSLDSGDEKVWSTNIPSITNSCTMYVKVERGETHEGNTSAYLTYFPNEEAEIDGLSLTAKDYDGTNYNWAEDSAFCRPYFTGFNWNTDFIEVRAKVGDGAWSEWTTWTGANYPQIVTGPGEYHYEFKVWRKDVGYKIASGTMTVEWSLNEVVLSNIQASSDRNIIEKNISILTGENISLPTATNVSAAVGSVASMPAYRITVTDSSVTLSNYINALGAELQAKGWRYLDGTSIKECGDTDVYIMPAIGTTGDETTFEFDIVYVTGVEE